MINAEIAKAASIRHAVNNIEKDIKTAIKAGKRELVIPLYGPSVRTKLYAAGYDIDIDTTNMVVRW